MARLSDSRSWCGRQSEIQTQNSVKLSDRLGQLARTVRPGNNLLGLRAIEMRTPVSHDPITAVRAITSPAIPDDGMIRNGDPCTVNYRQRRACRLQPRNAVGQTFGTSRDLREVRTGERIHHHRSQSGWESNQTDSNSSDWVAGQVAPTMRSTNEHNALDPRIRAKCCCANN